MKSIRSTRLHNGNDTTLEQGHDGRRAPVHRLPDELLAEIFKAGAKLINDESDLVDINFSLTVSWVSSRWRRVAISTSALWTTLKVDLPFQNAVKHASEKWTTLLTRSRGSSHLLDVFIKLGPSMTEFPLDYLPLTLLEVLERCQILVLASDGFCEQFVIPVKNPPPSFPSVYDILLSNVGFRTLSSFLDFIESFPRLTAFHLNTVFIDVADLTQNRVVRLEKLEILTVDTLMMDQGWDSTPLACLRMPRLKQLSLHGWDGEVPEELDLSSVSALSVSGNMPLPQPELIYLICGMPELTDLKIDVMIEDPDDFPSDMTITVPPLVDIDVSTSVNVEKLACWLVERLVKNRPEGSRITLSLSIDDTRPGPSISEAGQKWIEEKGVEVVQVPVNSEIDWERLEDMWEAAEH